MKKRILALLLAFVLAFCVCGCNSSEDEDENNVYETSFGKVYYPKEWSENLMLIEEEDCIIFHASIGDGEYDLFSLSVNRGDGDPVGQLTGNDGTVQDVYLAVYDLENIAILTAEQQNTLYAMQEALNVVLMNLK